MNRFHFPWSNLHDHCNCRTRHILAIARRSHPDSDRPSIADGVRHAHHRHFGAAQQRVFDCKGRQRVQGAGDPDDRRRKVVLRPVVPRVAGHLPGEPVFDRTSMNAWEDQGVIDRINAIGKQRLVIAGLWTSVCIVGPTLSAIEQGFQVYVITDACGDVSDEAHERAVTRMVQAGAAPMTSVQYLLELQRDWARGDTYALTTGIARAHAGGYGIGIQYAKSMFAAQEGGH
ncbi:isochorismatase family protein [Xanthomonas citri pv. glycines]|uniref:isochorismatase family protein n=1 Tax=Xanthomonas TaxID=338 RepID=UPI0012FBF0CF|nr:MULTISPECIES: isochorismatase family protein [Xanthomonas]QTK32908.1 isochorismatase family protein [Xanthomonas citri pv. glycines CFBP 2526]QTK37340.1 isochorismatase family protein [Xanthomonas citri pv. glycines]UIX77295.1 isochorismatase family protein [Xanthomonas citri pv. glycines]WLA18157.1 isochorismatase family protein [Xanthomonas citri pv. glycines]WLA27643.1 isochorismatase family protein [Xanthomonas citri pv. glycines]